MKLHTLINFFAFAAVMFADRGSQTSVPHQETQHNLSSAQDGRQGLADTSHLHLQRRGDGDDWMTENPVASDKIWGKAYDRGRNFLAIFGLSDREARQSFSPESDTIASPWKEFEDLQKWGFTQPHGLEDDLGPQTEFENGDGDGELGWGIADALRALHVDDRAYAHGGYNKVVLAVHGNFWEAKEGRVSYDQQSVMVEGRKIRATGGSLLFSINPAEGVLISMERLSVHSAAAERKPPVQGSELPNLSKFSDVLFLYWKSFTEGTFDSRAIRYFFSLSIANAETLGIIKRALPNENWDEFPVWPGRTITSDNDEFKAILGSPNARAFAYFLVQHKPDLGNKYITKVQIFRSTKEDTVLNMLLHVADAPLHAWITSDKKTGLGRYGML